MRHAVSQKQKKQHVYKGLISMHNLYTKEVVCVLETPDSACGSVFAYICQTAHITLRAPRHADGAAVQDETVA